MIPYFLLIAAVLLAWPVPLLLRRAQWVSRAPHLAMFVWQAVGLTGGLAMIGAPLMWGLKPLGDGLVQALTELFTVLHHHGWSTLISDYDWSPGRIAGVTAGLMLAAHLILTLLNTYIQTLRQRAKHRNAIALLSLPQDDASDLPDQKPDSDSLQLRVLPHDSPLAYCLPGMLGAIMVLSQGLVNRLSSAQLETVVAHEKAHLKQRHDLLRLAFESWDRACAWLPTTSVARTAVTELTEMLADDAALVNHNREDLLTAIALVAQADSPGSGNQSPAGQLDPHTPEISSLRIQRLLDPPPRLPVGTQWLLGVLASLILIVPTFMVLFN